MGKEVENWLRGRAAVQVVTLMESLGVRSA